MQWGSSTMKCELFLLEAQMKKRKNMYVESSSQSDNHFAKVIFLLYADVKFYRLFHTRNVLCGFM